MDSERFSIRKECAFTPVELAAMSALASVLAAVLVNQRQEREVVRHERSTAS